MVGQSFLHYKILEKLGEGGMGVVYKARDTHLDRFVAIKVLPPATVADAERKRRFVQEAKAASALNHPNIITVHDIAREGAVDFIAMEFVDGQTLARTIGRQGLPLAAALKYGVQTADALAAAHAAGIVHRDLKPANVMVTEKGLVKVLDFGLAKLVEPPSGEQIAATQTLQEPSHEGRVVGTAGYMAPEQIEGKRVDARSDVFAFGCVLYEMLTGQRVFERDSPASTMAAVLREEPKTADLAPSEAGRLVARCLRKDPERRFQHMGDLKLALEDLREEYESGRLGAAGAPQARRGVRPALALGVMLAVAAACVVGWWIGRSAAAPTQVTFTPLTGEPGQELWPTLSPEGNSFAYASRAAGNWDIYVQRVGGKNPVNLTKDAAADDTHPSFSPDGERIAFRSDRDGGGVFLMGATGESTRRLTDFGHHPSWSPDGREIVCSTGSFERPEIRPTATSRLVAVNASSGERREIPTGVSDAVQPRWSPHGRRIAFWGSVGGQRDIWTVPAQGGTAIRVTNDAHLDWSPAWSSDGKHLYFSSDRGGSMNLWRVPIDEESGRVSGPPQALTMPATYCGQISVSRDGRRIAYAQQSTTANLHKAVFDPQREAAVGEPVPVTRGSRDAVHPDVSPDGAWIVFTAIGRQEDIYAMRIDGSGIRQLTDDAYRDRTPRWSPDGKRISFFSNRSGIYEIWTLNPDGGGLRQLSRSSKNLLGDVWSPDGARIAGSVPAENAVTIEIGPDGKEKSRTSLPPLNQRDVWFFVGSWSPDGRFLAGHGERAEGGSSGVFVYSFASGAYERIGDGSGPRWLTDSRRLLAIHGSKIILVDSRTRQAREVLSVAPHEIDSRTLGLSRDDRTIVFSLVANEADVWLMSMQ